VPELKWSRDRLVHFAREPWFEDCLQLGEMDSGATDAQRTWLRSRIDAKTAGKLSVFGLQAAILGALERSAALVRASPISFAICDLVGGDVRDVLIGFSCCAIVPAWRAPTYLRCFARSRQ
jgi:hypothetical protein